MSYLRQAGSCSALRPTAVLRPWPRQSHSNSGVSAPGRVLPVAVVGESELDLEAFRERALHAEKPLLIKGRGGTTNHGGDSNGKTRSLPASRRWFEGAPSDGSLDLGKAMRLAPYLEQFSMLNLPYELMYPPHHGTDNPPTTAQGGGDALSGFLTWLANDTTTTGGIRPGLARFLSHHIAASLEGGGGESGGQRGVYEQQKLVRMQAPFALFMAAVEYNGTRAATAMDNQVLTQLYIAQAPLSELPHALQQDVPAPDLVRHAGRGDVYDSSLWLGLEPTYTPWHRDPNPNLFCQLCSGKTVRLMAPASGERIFRQVQTELIKQRAAAGAGAAIGSSRIRGEEMMQGPERRALHDAIWGAGRDDVRTSTGTIQEAHLDTGDMLFIPKGWWHSVRSAFADGRLNGSVNWWFR